MLIRKAQAEDAPGIARVHVESWRTTYAGMVPGEFLAGLSYEGRQMMWDSVLAVPERQRLVFVAETPERQVVGFASAGSERAGDGVYQGEIYALYLLQSYQRQGIGRQLFRAAASGLRQAGMASWLVWVLTGNPARKFYEAMGGQYLYEKEIEIGGKGLVEAAYGWKDTRIIMES